MSAAVNPRQLSFKHTVQMWTEWISQGLLNEPARHCSVLFRLIAQPRVGHRPGRIDDEQHQVVLPATADGLAQVVPAQHEARAAAAAGMLVRRGGRKGGGGVQTLEPAGRTAPADGAPVRRLGR